MTRKLSLLKILSALGSVVAIQLIYADEPRSLATDANTPEINTLTPAEERDGWILLFDGKTTTGWHTFKGSSVDPRWHVHGGELTLEASASRMVSGADLETDATFRDFDLRVEWRMSAQGNSGIFYRSSSKGVVHPWESGPEYQLLDNHGGDDPPIHQAGSVWDFYPPIRDVTRPLGEYNEARIVVRGNHVEHWMNGVKLLSFELNSDDFKARHAKSVFRQWTNYGTQTQGSIVLQDEGRQVSFRNIKIRRLD